MATLAAAPVATRGQRRSPKFRPLVGAIRWDAWYSPGSSETDAVQQTLAPEKYHYRLPFFAKIDHGVPRLPPLSQAEIDLEIRQARFAGLDYWAFVAYGEANPLSSALSYYLSSRHRDDISFCFFTELSRWGTVIQPSALVDEHLTHMKRRQYVRVFDGRPLYYLGFIDKEKITQNWGGVEGLSSQIAKFRRLCMESGNGNPYLVLAGNHGDVGYWALLGGDAIGAYTISDPKGSGSYAELSKLVEARWRNMAKYNLPVIPTVVAGWDRRPRVEHPVPWELGQKPGVGVGYYFGMPTGDELASLLEQALRFVADQDHESPSVLIYAWNENDEGGWLVPTMPCDTQRLAGLHRILASHRSEANPECRIER
jgi:hypothetical protein